jgi:hypothetical protein
MTRLYIIATLAALGAAFYAVWHVSGVYHTAPYIKAAVAAQDAALAQTERMIADERDNDQRAAKREADLTLAADRARAAADRLRRSAIASDGGDAAPASAGHETTARKLLAECGDMVGWLAGQADQHAADLTRLQDWARAIGAAE